MHKTYSDGREKSFEVFIKLDFYDTLKAPSPMLIYFLCGLYKHSGEDKVYNPDDESLSGNSSKYQFHQNAECSLNLSTPYTPK